MDQDLRSKTPLAASILTRPKSIALADFSILLHKNRTGQTILWQLVSGGYGISLRFKSSALDFPKVLASRRAAPRNGFTMWSLTSYWLLW